MCVLSVGWFCKCPLIGLLDDGCISVSIYLTDYILHSVRSPIMQKNKLWKRNGAKWKREKGVMQKKGSTVKRKDDRDKERPMGNEIHTSISKQNMNEDDGKG